jgi:hypothetical protein
MKQFFNHPKIFMKVIIFIIIFIIFNYLIIILSMLINFYSFIITIKYSL